MIVGTILNLAALAVTATAGIFAFGFARGFVRRRLRFVDAVRSPGVPVLAAVVAGLLVLPLTLLPLVTGLTAAVVGIGAGLGTRSGVKALQRGDIVVR
ncbi:MAG TPA: hypothetical protein VGP87_06210 [Gemmatimonadales bacterium]|jgi:hypothetical protein|nr:hypothetical protein [Gemmatimonadales bacterium]